MNRLQRPDTNKIPITKKNQRNIDTLQRLIAALEKKELSENFVEFVNTKVDEVNSFEGKDFDRRKLIRKNNNSIIQKAKSELGLFPKNHFMGLWMSLGMAAFGLPIGLLFSWAFDSMAYIGLGLPIGLSFGMAIGMGIDKTKEKEGKQFDFKLSY